MKAYEQSLILSSYCEGVNMEISMDFIRIITSIGT